MSMSSESQAKLAGLKSSEWNKFIKDYVKAESQYLEDKANLETAQKNEYQLMEGLSTLFFVLSSSYLSGAEEGDFLGGLPKWQQAGVSAAAGVAAAGVVDVVDQRPEIAQKTLENAGYDIYQPLVNKTQAWEMTQNIEEGRDTTLSAYDQYQSDSWSGVGLNVLSKTGSFTLGEVGAGGSMDWSEGWPWSDKV